MLQVVPGRRDETGGEFCEEPLEDSRRRLRVGRRAPAHRARARHVRCAAPAESRAADGRDARAPEADGVLAVPRRRARRARREKRGLPAGAEQRGGAQEDSARHLRLAARLSRQAHGPALRTRTHIVSTRTRKLTFCATSFQFSNLSTCTLYLYTVLCNCNFGK